MLGSAGEMLWRKEPAQADLDPALNGRRLPLKPYETSRSLAIAPDGQHFALGADWTLRLFDRPGVEVWQRPAPSAIWAVTISANGRLLVAGYGDGTIRWHRLEDGEELLAFYPDGDRERWVVWTPQGYGKTIVFLDACYAGNVKGPPADPSRAIADLAAEENGVIVFASASASQLSEEYAKGRNGAFTEALLTGFGGKADYDTDRIVRFSELRRFVCEEVETLTDKRQQPVAVIPEKRLGDPPLLVIR